MRPRLVSPGETNAQTLGVVRKGDVIQWRSGIDLNTARAGADRDVDVPIAFGSSLEEEHIHFPRVDVAGEDLTRTSFRTTVSPRRISATAPWLRWRSVASDPRSSRRAVG